MCRIGQDRAGDDGSTSNATTVPSRNIDSYTLALARLRENLEQARRDQVHRLVAELAADPGEMLPSGSKIRLTAELQSCINAVEAVIEEESR
jgi:hypothetical protein